MQEKIKITKIIFYTSLEGNLNRELIGNNETFWLSKKYMLKLFDCNIFNISLHIKNILKASS